MRLPKGAPVLDLRRPMPESVIEGLGFAIGRYNEKREGSYTAPQFQLGTGPRNIHVGVDLFAPAGTEVFAFAEGEIFQTGRIDLPLDYGHLLLTRHWIGRVELFALWGHLSQSSIEGKKAGDRFQAGERLGWCGNRDENGGWPPHLHLQLSFERPESCDLPGVVAEEDLPQALLKYPDPRLVLGPIY